MIKRNFFTPEQIDVLQALVGNKMVGLFNNEDKQEINYEERVTIATEETNVCLQTFDVLEGLDLHRFEEYNVWCVELSEAPQSDTRKPDPMPVWFAGQEILDVQVIRTQVISYQGDIVAWEYFVDTGVVLTFKAGHLAIYEAHFDWPGFLEAEVLPVLDLCLLPQPSGPFSTGDDTLEPDGWPPSRHAITSVLVALSEARVTKANFFEGLARRYFRYVQGIEAYRLQKLVGQTLLKFSLIGDETQFGGIHLSTASESIEIIAYREDREFFGGQKNIVERFSCLVVDPYGKPNLNETDIADFQYLHQIITKIELVDERMVGKIFGLAKETMPWSNCSELAKKHDGADGYRWEYGSTVAVIIHFETGSLVISRGCYHDWILNLQVIPLGDPISIERLSSRFEQMKHISWEYISRGSHTLEAGAWAGLGPLHAPELISPDVAWSTKCPGNCSSKVRGFN